MIAKKDILKSMKEFLKPTSKKFIYFSLLFAPFLFLGIVFILGLLVFLPWVILGPIGKLLAFYSSFFLLPFGTVLYAFIQILPYTLGNISLALAIVAQLSFWWYFSCLAEKKPKLALVLLAALIITASIFVFPWLSPGFGPSEV